MPQIPFDQRPGLLNKAKKMIKGVASSIASGVSGASSLVNRSITSIMSNESNPERIAEELESNLSDMDMERLDQVGGFRVRDRETPSSFQRPDDLIVARSEQIEQSLLNRDDVERRTDSNSVLGKREINGKRR